MGAASSRSADSGRSRLPDSSGPAAWTTPQTMPLEAIDADIAGI
jgi:hypothetical protein